MCASQGPDDRSRFTDASRARGGFHQIFPKDNYSTTAQIFFAALRVFFLAFTCKCSKQSLIRGPAVSQTTFLMQRFCSAFHEKYLICTPSKNSTKATSSRWSDNRSTPCCLTSAPPI